MVNILKQDEYAAVREEMKSNKRIPPREVNYSQERVGLRV